MTLNTDGISLSIRVTTHTGIQIQPGCARMPAAVGHIRPVGGGVRPRHHHLRPVTIITEGRFLVAGNTGGFIAPRLKPVLIFEIQPVNFVIQIVTLMTGDAGMGGVALGTINERNL